MRGTQKIETIKPDSDSVQYKKIMGENELRLTFELNYHANFELGDTAEVFGETYKINKLPVVDKISTFDYKYTLTMQAGYYDLSKVQYLFYDENNNLKETDFSLMGNADTFIDLMLKNIERVYPGAGWKKGQVIPTDYVSMSFSAKDCLSVLADMVNQFQSDYDVEYWIVGQTINFTKIQDQTGKLFRHGKNKGLYEITRQLVDDAPFITRLYVFGSDKNIPTDYANYSSRLRLPGYKPYIISSLTAVVTDNGNGTTTFVFTYSLPTATNIDSLQIEYRNHGSSDAWATAPGAYASPREITIPTGNYDFRFRTFGLLAAWEAVTDEVNITQTTSDPVLINKPQAYVERNTDQFGIIEGTQIFDTIYPSRTGIVTAVDAGNVYKFKDTNLDFNLNDQLLAGVAANITFLTGQLAGYTFEISNFNVNTNEFTIIKNKNELSVDVPSFELKPAIGDQYVLTNIKMPQNYIEDAENKLLEWANEFMDVYATPTYNYVIVFDQTYLRKKQFMPQIGQLIWIQDDEMKLNDPLRIATTQRNILQEYNLQVEVSNVLTNNKIDKINQQLSGNTSSINNINNSLSTNSVLNNRAVGDFTIDQGTLIGKDIQQAPAGGTYKNLVIDATTGKVYYQ
jgi:hypothetical protein